MTLSTQHIAPVRLASVVAQAYRGRMAYLVASGVDPAQGRREAVASISRAVAYEASVISSTDLLVLLGLALVLALAIALGVKRDPYSDAARPGFALVASRPAQTLH